MSGHNKYQEAHVTGNSSDFRGDLLTALSLGMLMVLTRGLHGGDALHLPDGSTAIFFLAGLYLRHWIWFVALLLLAGLIDYMAIQLAGVSDFCITPAYVFLVPTYAVLWFSGRSLLPHQVLTRPGLVRLLLVLLPAVVVAHELSSGSFYLFSGYIAEPDIGEYLARALTYLPGYMRVTVMYVAFGLTIHWGLQTLSNVRLQRRSSR